MTTTTTSHPQTSPVGSARATQVVHRPGYVGAPACSRAAATSRSLIRSIEVDREEAEQPAERTCTCAATSDHERPSLTDREIEVLRTWLMLDSKPAVAQELFISLGTVNTHLTRIRAKYADIGRAAPPRRPLGARAAGGGRSSPHGR